jgi:hypothetical protein
VLDLVAQVVLKIVCKTFEDEVGTFKLQLTRFCFGVQEISSQKV